MRIWLILWDMVFWSQWNAKMVISVMTLILAVGRNMIWMITLPLCMISLKNIRDKIYIRVSEATDVAKNIVGGNFIFISQRLDGRGVLFIRKGR